MSLKVTLFLVAVCLVIAVVGLAVGWFARLPGNGNIVVVATALMASVVGQYPSHLLRHSRLL
ncbi:hypothetical protein [Azorhizobium sp. AG788]|uniref:hypothetical protein n=1 Tax=Azorhizobium sp. AG788 TaxID=2183897 RepID=UPI003139776D